jgi:benzoyl-CoA 2,3-epoxidase subunit B
VAAAKRAVDADAAFVQTRGGKLVEKEVPMLNALNEVLRDDYIRDSVAGVERWNKVIDKAGIPFRLKVPHFEYVRFA